MKIGSALYEERMRKAEASRREWQTGSHIDSLPKQPALPALTNPPAIKTMSKAIRNCMRCGTDVTHLHHKRRYCDTCRPERIKELGRNNSNSIFKQELQGHGGTIADLQDKLWDARKEVADLAAENAVLRDVITALKRMGKPVEHLMPQLEERRFREGRNEKLENLIIENERLQNLVNALQEQHSRAHKQFMSFKKGTRKTQQKTPEIVELHDQGMPMREIAAETGVSPATVCRVVNAEPEKPAPEEFTVESVGALLDGLGFSDESCKEASA